MTTAVLCTALLGILLFGLGFLVSLRRGATNVITGLENDPASALNKAVRAHGNTAEYAPMLGVLMIYLGFQSPAGWVVWAMIIATISRFVMVMGFLTCETLAKPHPLKIAGSLGTYLGGLALAAAAILTVV